MSDKLKLFDSSAEYTIKTLDGLKEATVRYPSDKDHCDHYRHKKTIRHKLGRDKFRDESPDARKADADLFAKIRVDQDGQPFDEYEAAAVIGRLELTKVLRIDRTGNEYSVTMKVFGGIVTTHRVRAMSQKLADEFQEAVGGKHTNSARFSEFRTIIDPALDLYRAVVIEATGYAEGVEIPIIHKFAVVSAVLDDQFAVMEEPDPEL